MNKLIKYFNEKYGDKYGKISYPRTIIQIYQTYQIIKDCNLKDEKLLKLLDDIKLPKPKTIEEREMYSECLYEVSGNEFDRDIFDIKEKKCLYKNILSVEDADYERGFTSYIFSMDATFGLNVNSSYHIILNEETLSNLVHLDEKALAIISENKAFMVEMAIFENEMVLNITLPSEVDIINFSLWENDECIFRTQLLSQDSSETEITKDNYTFEINENFNFNDYSSYYFVINNEIHRDEYKIINNRIEFSSEDMEVFFSNSTISIEKNDINNYINIELWEDEEKNIKNSYLNKDVIIKRSLSIGNNTPIMNDGSFAQGFKVLASGENSHAEGNRTTASGSCSHAEGYNSTASGSYSHAEGYETTALGDYSHAEGIKTTALGDCSHAEGESDYKASSRISNLSIDTTNEDIMSTWETEKFSLAKNNSHVEGGNTIALGDSSHAEGCQTTALGDYSHAEGAYTDALGDYSHAEGYASHAERDYSHAEGSNNYAKGICSHVEGSGSHAEGTSSHAEGSCTYALGYGSHSEGKNTKASSESQHVQGKYNIEDTANKYAHIVGNGTDNSTRSNAHTLDWNGNGWYAGDVYVKGDNQDNGKKLLSTSDIYFNENGELVVTINGVTKTFTPKA